MRFLLSSMLVNGTLKCDHIKRLITLTSDYIKRLSLCKNLNYENFDYENLNYDDLDYDNLSCDNFNKLGSFKKVH